LVLLQAVAEDESNAMSKPIILDQSFDPEVTKLMGNTLDAAWVSLTPGETAPHKRGWARETLALRIIEAVKGGERDAARLRQDALVYLKLAAARQQGLFRLLVH
jgi:hypothetical protein